MTEHEFSRELTALYPWLMPVAMKLTNNRDRAQDLVQDTMLLAWSYRHSFLNYKGEQRFTSWISVIMHNRAFTLARREKVRFTFLLIEADGASTHGAQEGVVVLNQVLTQFAKLPRQQQDALVLNARGESGRDAASIMGIAEGTQKSRVFRARQTLTEMCQ